MITPAPLIYFANAFLPHQCQNECLLGLLRVTISLKGDENMGKKYNPDVRNTILDRYRAGEPVTIISSDFELFSFTCPITVLIIEATKRA